MRLTAVIFKELLSKNYEHAVAIFEKVYQLHPEFKPTASGVILNLIRDQARIICLQICTRLVELTVKIKEKASNDAEFDELCHLIRIVCKLLHF
jgi:hypothetical protein